MVHLGLEIGLVDLLVLATAVYYLVTLIVEEDGPFDIFAKLRELAGMRTGRWDWDEETDTHTWVDVDRSTSDRRSYVWRESDGMLSKIVSCHRCASPYSAVIILMMWLLFPPLVYILAVSGAVVFMKEM